MLKRPSTQVIFIKKDGLNKLVSLLQKDSTTASPQLLYLVGFCIWLLSFNPECLGELKKNHVVKEVVRLIRISVREKIIRISFATLRNLLDKEEKFNEDMIGQDLIKLAQTLASKNWKDKDIEDDIKVVSQKLERSVEELSSFEMYVAEIQSGALHWSPVHSELFWRENVMRFEDKNFAFIGALVEVLKIDAKEPEPLEVACYDLGEFARFYPDGKRIIEKFGGKVRLLHLMGHGPESFAKVRKQALLCVQKLMVTNWEYFNKNSASGGSGGKGKSKTAT